MPVTRDQAQMLAALACAARPYGAAQWDPAGVVAAVSKVAGLELADVAMATMRAAADRDLKTPGAIGNTATSAWRERVTETPVHRTEHEPSCGICGFTRSECRRRWEADHDFEPIGEVRVGDATAGRARLREMR